MAIHVNRVRSEVTADSEPAAGDVTQPTAWEELDRVRVQQARIALDKWRTSAEGFDD